MGGGGSTYDYGFRIYNPNIAKFLSVDPLTKDYPWNSSLVKRLEREQTNGLLV